MDDSPAATSSPAPAPAPGPGGAKEPPARRTAVFRLETARIDPALDGRPLAARWQRLAGIGIDLVVVAALSVFSGPMLALGTGATIASLGGRNVSPTRAWAVVRWVFIALGTGVMLAAVALMFGRPLVRTGAFNLLRAAPAASRAAAVEPLPLVPSKEDYRRANTQLAAQVVTLQGENAQLRANLRGSSWLNAASDFSRTLGLTFGWAGVYFTLCLAWLRGRTLGKFLVGSRVVRLDGRPLTTLDAFTRYGGYAAGLATGMIGFARLLWEPNRQAIQDKIAWTVVLRGR
ncbi:MAG: RDD family protein [Opitutaceae bacterium]|nr:RDD family protein [Opitutaceae bacterium]